MFGSKLDFDFPKYEKVENLFFYVFICVQGSRSSKEQRIECYIEYLKKDFFATTKPKKHLDARIRTDKFSQAEILELVLFAYLKV